MGMYLFHTGVKFGSDILVAFLKITNIVNMGGGCQPHTRSRIEMIMRAVEV